jgi:polyisoprenoid-binding protein YceI
MTRDLKSFAPGHQQAIMLGLLALLLFSPVTAAQSSKGAPVYKITPVVSKITFFVKASIAIDGTFDKWDTSLKFTSPDVSTGVLDVKIQADSVNTGSDFKDDKLKSKDFFDVKTDPYITFHSSKIVQTGPHTFDVPGSLRFAAFRNRRHWHLPTILREKARERSRGQWRSNGVRPQRVRDG